MSEAGGILTVADALSEREVLAKTGNSPGPKSRQLKGSNRPEVVARDELRQRRLSNLKAVVEVLQSDPKR
jgi:hypothetical protein